MRLISVLICLLCSTVWIFRLNNSIANKKIYLFCVILALISTVLERETMETVEKAFENNTKSRLFFIPAFILAIMVMVANWNLFRGDHEDVIVIYLVTVLVSGIYVFYKAILGLLYT